MVRCHRLSQLSLSFLSGWNEIEKHSPKVENPGIAHFFHLKSASADARQLLCGCALLLSWRLIPTLFTHLLNEHFRNGLRDRKYTYLLSFHVKTYYAVELNSKFFRNVVMRKIYILSRIRGTDLIKYIVRIESGIFFFPVTDWVG